MSVRGLRGAAAALAAAGATLAAAPVAAAGPTGEGRPAGEGTAPSWAEAFVTDPSAADVHAVVRYRGSDGAWHRLELWRHGDRSVHRRTDDRLDVFVARDERAAGGLRYQVRDARRGTLIEVDRANLFRIGIFSDWASLAHLLREPAEPVTLARGPAASCPDAVAVRVTPVAAGASAAPVREVCWSPRWGLPMRVTQAGADGLPMPVLELLQVEAARPGDPGFAPPAPAPDGGYVDANADIDPAAD